MTDGALERGLRAGCALEQRRPLALDQLEHAGTVDRGGGGCHARERTTAGGGAMPGYPAIARTARRLRPRHELPEVVVAVLLGEEHPPRQPAAAVTATAVVVLAARERGGVQRAEQSRHGRIAVRGVDAGDLVVAVVREACR